MPLNRNLIYTIRRLQTPNEIRRAFHAVRGQANGRIDQLSIDFFAGLECHPDAETVVAVAAVDLMGQVVGFSGARITPMGVLFMSVTLVASDWRSRGLGTALLREKVAVALEGRQDSNMVLRTVTNVRNVRMQRILLQCGFYPDVITESEGRKLVQYVWQKEG